MNDDRERRATELWFRARGLPSIVGGRADRLLVRIIPAIAFLLAWDLLNIPLEVLDGESEEHFERLMESDLLFAGYHLLWFAAFVAPVVAAWVAARWMRKRVVAGDGTPTAIALISVYTFGPLLEMALIGEELTLPDLLFGVLFGVGLIGVLLGLTLIGAGSVFGSALRSAGKQLKSVGSLTTRALPLLLLFAVFGLLTNEVWQMSAAASTSRMWLLVGLFLLVGILFLVSTARQELRKHIETAPQRVPLRRAERADMVLVLVLTQLVQALLVAMVMFVFFVLFGLAALKEDLMKTWSGRDLTTGNLFGVQLSAPHELLHVSLFIAAFSALYFITSTVTDALYRPAFFDPFTVEMAVSLAERDEYLARWHTASNVEVDQFHNRDQRPLGV
ncbi:hypothetical protein SAMN05192558_104309 [Actinokineospora alba]|uniref:Uncharacterized protein n=1 Tax=Actinokineospora alba TaxID=504798 RepID=A0A1H0LWR4_9PSEU|nr:hypothetical protein [Actinokineospora alba]TDP67481.1 hypothetical protein C8E96_3026 [Actinokineospora alba]SDI47233.1 hypothetical protein SAMN05421871_105151 [Actinokineospora alba]SDO72380.1 hypothetical protein SAMN05192558_104309 [Actinokineospora alba]